ncbi:helix-turn-helix domain-containing protein [Pseudovibrio axinellae]|uniref:helix-turn-helix domain-containing protein n=1 Tax=Pseudovibrio axinellae TaxID=989403 RepID=UPI003B8452DA
MARDLVHQGKSISAVARTFGVHPATIYRCLEKKLPCGTFSFLSAAHPNTWEQKKSALPRT